MTQEQYILASQPSALQRPGCPAPYPVGIYGWRKRCLYFFILLLLVTMIVNLALTIWILKVMNFTVVSESLFLCLYFDLFFFWKGSRPIWLVPTETSGTYFLMERE